MQLLLRQASRFLPTRVLAGSQLSERHMLLEGIVFSRQPHAEASKGRPSADEQERGRARCAEPPRAGC